MAFNDHTYNVEMEKKDSNLKIKMDTSLFCSVNLEDITNLKCGTQRLLTLLESIESKATTITRISNAECTTDDSSSKFEQLTKPAIVKNSDMIRNSFLTNFNSCTNSVDTSAQAEVYKVNKGTANYRDLIELEAAARQITTIKFHKDDDTDCSVYKKLTNVCHCLNKTAYNDFVMQFHSKNHYFTNTTGEIIKNLRILKNFLYMGTTYTKNALLFLNDGLTFSAHGESVEIIQGCSHADICNIFEDQSIVKFCINWPRQYPAYGDSTTQSLAANFLYKMCKMPEGRRYLNFNTKISHDIASALKKKDKILPSSVADVLQFTISLLRPNSDVIEPDDLLYEFKPMQEDLCNFTLQTLILHRRYMTFEEILSHLNTLINLSIPGKGVRLLVIHLKVMINLFKRLILDYDSFEMNCAITSIMMNIILYVKKREKAAKPEIVPSKVPAVPSNVPAPQSLTICLRPPSHTMIANQTKSILPVPSVTNYINQSFNSPPKRTVRRVTRSKNRRCMKKKKPAQQPPMKRAPVLPPSRRSILEKVSVHKYRSTLQQLDFDAKDPEVKYVSLKSHFKVPSKLFESSVQPEKRPPFKC